MLEVLNGYARLNRQSTLTGERIMEHRTYGETKNCKGCRFWSEMIARSQGAGIAAYCLSDSGERKGKYTLGYETCSSYKSGHLGAIDEPPNYGEEIRRQYELEGE